MSRGYKVLNKDQVESFLERGYLVVKGCLDKDFAQHWIDRAYERLGYDKGDPSTWAKDLVHLYPTSRRAIRDISPKAWAAICDVVGGADRIEDTVKEVRGHFAEIDSFTWSDAFIVNFNRGADEPWQPPSAEVGGWHKDGSFFRHFLNSREQVLLTTLYWSDVGPRGGGTFIATDSVRHVAQFLADHPEGVPPGDIPFGDLIGQCEAFEEITGKLGDFVILHPFMLHASSYNPSGVPRWMTNPPVALKEQFDLNRSDPDDFSLLERATLHYLGLERLDFRPASPYEPYWRDTDVECQV